MNQFEAVSSKTETSSWFEENVSRTNLLADAVPQAGVSLRVGILNSEDAVGSFVRTFPVRQHRWMKGSSEDVVVGRNGFRQSRVVLKDSLLIQLGVVAVEKPWRLKYSNVSEGQS